MAIPTITASTLFNLNVSPKILTFTDTTNYGLSLINPYDVSGILTITSPSGIIHSNQDYNSPDTYPNSQDYTQNIPLNASSAPIQGQYLFNYNIRVTRYLSDPVSMGGNSFILGGGDYTQYLSPGQILYIPGGTNQGEWNIVSYSFDSNNMETTIVVSSSTLPGASIGFAYVYNFYQNAFVYEFCYATPQIDIEQTYDCDCSKLLSRDLTNYTINVCGGQIAPTTIARVHTLYSPLGENGTPVAPTLSSSLPSLLATPLWTNNWRSTISTMLTYTLPTGLQVQLRAYGEENIFVSCSDGLCCVYECLANLYLTYNSLMDSNPTQGQKYEKLWQEAVGAWMLYSIATSCGNSNRQKYLNIIIGIAKSTNCDCCNEERQDVSRMIVPICGLPTAGGTGSGNVVITAGNGIDVSYSNVGTTDTWQVSLDTAVVEAIVSQYIQDNPLVFSDLSTSFLSSLTTYVNGFININNLGGVTINSPVSGQVLQYDGSSWINAPIPVTFQKAYVLNSFTTPEERTTTGIFSTMGQTMPLATGNNPLSANGDTVEFEMFFTTSGSSLPYNRFFFAINGSPIAGQYFPSSDAQGRITMMVTRKTATTLLITGTHTRYSNYMTSSTNSEQLTIFEVTVANIGSTPLVIAPYAILSGGGKVICESTTYKSVKK